MPNSRLEMALCEVTKEISLLVAPSALGVLKIAMTRVDAAHVWLRSTIRELGKQL